MKNKNKAVGDLGDKYTYFVTSPAHDFILIKKLHVCTWLFENRDECVEVGIHIEFSDPEAIKDLLRRSFYGEYNVLPVYLWISWVRKSDTQELKCLYQQISKQENAQFVFNDDCTSVSNCSKWNEHVGRKLCFAKEKSFCVFPVNLKRNDGCVCCEIVFPDEYMFDTDVYVRFCAEVPESSISFHNDLINKQIYTYNINVNQMRNAPSVRSFKAIERCRIRAVYAIHIMPSCYSQSFVDKKAFCGMRFLEFEKYKRYIDGVKCLNKGLLQDHHFVTFNKLEQDKGADLDFTFSFCSVYDQDIIGKKLRWSNGLFALLGAVIGLLLSWMQGCIPGCGQYEMRQQMSVIQKDVSDLLSKPSNRKCRCFCP